MTENIPPKMNEHNFSHCFEMNYTSPKQKPPNKDRKEEIETLTLGSFCRAPIVDFGLVKKDKTQSRRLRLRNIEEFEQIVSIEKFPYKANFTINQKEVTVGPLDTQLISMSWTPSAGGNVREKVIFKLNSTIRLESILLGKCESPVKPKQKKKLWKLPKPPSTPYTKSAVKERFLQTKEECRSSSLSPKRTTKPPQTASAKREVFREIQRNKLDDTGEIGFKEINTKIFDFANQVQSTPRDTYFVPKGTNIKQELQLKLSEDESKQKLSPKKRSSDLFDDSLKEDEAKEFSEEFHDSLNDEDSSTKQLVIGRETVVKGRPDMDNIPIIDHDSESVARRRIFPDLTASLEKNSVTRLKRRARRRSKTVTKEKPTLDLSIMQDSFDSSMYGNDGCMLDNSLLQKTPIKKITEIEKPKSKDGIEILSGNVNSTRFTEPKQLDKPLKIESLNKTDKVIKPLKKNLMAPPRVLPKMLEEKTKKSNTSPKKVNLSRSKTITLEKSIAVKRRSIEVTPLDSSKKLKRKEIQTSPITKRGRINDSKVNSTLCSRIKPVKGIPQAKLVLSKSVMSTPLPKHPLPFVAKNMYYDERWIDKQEAGFKRWLNFVLTPSAEEQVDTKKPLVDRGQLNITTNHEKTVKLAPTKEMLSFKAYSARKQLNKLRRKAISLWQRENVIKILHRLEVEICSERLKIRPDKKIHADLGLKYKLLDVFLSYNPLWLRIALETVYGELILINSNQDIIGLSKFILTRVLNSPDIQKEFAHPNVPHLYKSGYEEAIAQHILKKFLCLVLFLDLAKNERLINHDPILFCIDSEFKTSRDILLYLSKNCLQGEGDVTRHLSHLGYKVTYAQRAIDEYSFGVTSLATDLRDGVRLTRVIELLLTEFTLTNQLRLPALSRLQKIHNIQLCFKALSRHSVDLESDNIEPKHITDGHREKTLSLLWKVILKFQVEIGLSEQQLREEIIFLTRHNYIQRQMAALTNDREKIDLDGNIVTSTGDTKVQLLLKWCQAVCLCYNIEVENFSVSFSDGRVLCYIIRHYHPALLPEDAIHNETTQSMRPDNKSFDEDDIDLILFLPDAETRYSSEYDKLLQNEQKNFKVINQAVSELGGVPMMLKTLDISGTIPDEKVLITYVSCLCVRLLDLRSETRAARIIQAAWRRHHLEGRKKYLHKQHNAAIKIQHIVRRFLKKRFEERKKKSVTVLQRSVRRWLAKRRINEIKREKDRQIVEEHNCIRVYILRKKLSAFKEKKRNEAATVIQRWLLSVKAARAARCYFLTLKSTVIQLQALFRQVSERKRFLKKLEAVTKIQIWWRSILECRKNKQRFQFIKKAVIRIQTQYRCYYYKKRFTQMRKSASTIQLAFRRYVVKKEVKRQINAAICIQKHWKKFSCRKSYLHLKRSVIKIQSLFRCYHQREVYLKEYNATLIIQKRWRAFLQGRKQRINCQLKKAAVITIQRAFRRQLQSNKERNAAALVIQSHFRRFLCMKNFKSTKRAVVFIQRRYRATRQTTACIKEFSQLKFATILIQSHFRGWQCRKKYIALRRIVIFTQSLYRMKRERKEFLKIKQKAIFIQCTFRASKQRRQYIVLKRAVVKLQALLRMRRERLRFVTQRNAAVIVQKNVKRFLKRLKFTKLKAACLVISKFSRMTICRRKFLSQKRACVVIQSAFRRFSCKRRFLTEKKAAIVIQKTFRMHLKKKLYEKMKSSAITIQKRYRAIKLMKLAKHHFISIRSSCVIIQRFWRNYVWKRNRETAALIIQRFVLTNLIAKSFRNEYLELKKCTIIVQSIYRRWHQRREYQNMKRAAVIIQSNYRRYADRCHYVELREATVLIQRRFRSKKCLKEERKRFCQIRNGIIGVQRLFRIYLWKKKLLRECGATLIQRCFRRYIARKNFLRFKSAAILIQSNWRTFAARRRYEAIRNGICKFQFLYRTYICRKKFTQALRSLSQLKLEERQKNAATKVQSAWRMYAAKKSMLIKKQKVVILQSFLKMYIERKRYIAKKNSAIILQRFFRNYMSKRREKNAIKVQSIVRCFLERKKFLAIRKSIITIQTHFRKRLRHRNLQRERAALQIQSAWRMHVRRNNFKRTRDSAILIQRAFRNWHKNVENRRAFVLKEAMSVKIQAFWRGYRYRKMFVNYRLAAKTIQSRFRAYSAGKKQRSLYKSMKKSVILIESIWIRYKEKQYKQNLCHLMKQHSAAKKIQKCYKSWKNRQNYLRVGACIVIQSTWRSVVQRRQFIKLKKATIVIQNLRRRRLAIRRSNELERNALVLQSFSRMYLARRKLINWRQAAVVIQRAWKAHIVYKKYHVQRSAAITIQKYLRMSFAQKQYGATRTAIIRLQAFFRMCQARKEFKEIEEKVVITQCCVRRFLARNRKLAMEDKLNCQSRQKLIIETNQRHLAAFRIQRAYKRYRKCQALERHLPAIICLQTHVRGFLARKRVERVKWAANVIKRHVRVWLLRQERVKRDAAARRIQAVARGYLVRRRNKNDNIETVRERLQIATENAREEMTLGRRTRSALDFLLLCRDLSRILDSLIHLEVSTRLSALCCENLAQENAVPVLYRLIKCCNRSVPHMEIIKYCISILVNLVKHEKTSVYACYNEDMAETLAELICMYRDKGSIFHKTCLLLGLAVRRSQTVTTAIRTQSRLCDRLKAVYTLIRRRQNLDEQRKFQKARCSQFLPPVKTKRQKRPSSSSSCSAFEIQPDWVLSRSSVREIDEPIMAIRFVLNCLGLIDLDEVV
ncbi:DgyrCDS10292 [Dimorphilus gyrociliatus]|uniref:DgyrCDS10292 n=1 Tax=Dimorphilus gyrociliatus TaxID=2664684 RepID=A0A7I8W2C4_9ANNE|nr:DgyrCDS10292 [Dimorphilus gyrociliatus]